MKHSFKYLSVITVFILLVSLTNVFAQKKKLTIDDYGQWQQLRSTVLSKDGKWFAYVINLVEGGGWMMLQDVATGSEKKLQSATRPVFSNDSKWLVFTIGRPEEQRRQMRNTNIRNRTTIGLMNLVTSETETIEGIHSFALSNDGKFLVLKKVPAKDKESTGSDLIVRNLETGVDDIFGNVTQYSFNKDGSLLALLIHAEEKLGNGVHLIKLGAYSRHILDSHKALYSGLTWNKDGNALAFLRAKKNDDYEGDNHLVFAFRDLDKGKYKKTVYDPSKDTGFTEGYRIVGERELQWSDDNKTLFFGVKDWKKKEEKKRKNDDLPPAGVDVWHWKDEPISPGKKLIADQLRNFNYLAAWHIDDNKFVQIARGNIKNSILTGGDRITRGNIENIVLTGDEKHAVGYDQKPYEPVFEDNWKDIYLFDVMTGEKKELMKKEHLTMSPSPGGKYLMYYKDKQWWTYNIQKNKHTSITKDIPADFENTTRVNGLASFPAWGSSAWFEDDEAVLLYDQYDVYKVSSDGNNWERLTYGADDRIRFRFVNIYSKDDLRVGFRANSAEYYEDFIESDKPLYFSAYGDFTKESGYYRLEKGKKLEKLIYEPCSVGKLSKVEDKDIFLFQKQRADVSPNVFMTGWDFSNPKQLTGTNPQQKDYYWAGSELITYKNKDGVELQGSLLYPANYQPGMKYPMIVRLYEQQSQTLHNYRLPTKYNAYNERRWSSEGFFYYEPDIVNKLNDPGLSAVDCVVPAVEAVLKTGMVDRGKIGLMGHSWGAYETCFIITQTDLFSAAIAGAAPTNMISLSGVVADSYGQLQLHFFETAQPRLAEPFWVIRDNYWNNSSLFQAQNITTPLMIAFGNRDGTINWNQGVEMYTLMRRLQKPFVLLVYDGEGHGLRKRENQFDYAARAHEWMRHYLLGEKPAKWITDGVNF